MLMTLWAYVSYTEQSGLKTYFLALSLFALGLMSKSMVVTLPFLLLLLDFWPLGRLSFVSDMKRQGPSSPVPTHKILWEKAPFFLLSIIVSIVTLLTRQDRLTDTTRLLYSFSERIIRTIDGYTFYVWKMFLPIDLSIPYQLDNPVFNWQSLLSLVFLAGLSILCLKHIKKRPYLMVGWLWYLGTLAPVSGIIQTGPTILADRYVYIPLIGLFIMLSWGLREIIDRGWRVKRAVAAMMVLIMVIYSLLSVKQLRYWKDSVTLFSRAIAVNPDNNLARQNLGIALYEDDKLSEAEGYLKEVVRRSSEKSTAYLYLALIASSKGQHDSAISYLRSAIEADPRNTEAHVNLGIALAGRSEYKQADESFSEALKIEPGLVKAHYNYAASLYLQHRDEEAVEELTKTLEIDPNFKQARDLLNSIQMANNE
jgi:tetratricopeptide (TPR) repeat protein